MPKADMQRRHFEVTVATLRLLMSIAMHARGSRASDRSSLRFISNNITREAA